MALHNDPNWLRAGNWFAKGVSSCDFAIVGVGASKSALTPNQAQQSPNSIREALMRYSTFHATKNVELTNLSASDFGDVADPDDQNKTITELTSMYSKAKALILLGGDNSITYSGVSALGKDVGVITLDAHHDVRDGVSNGSPIRQLVEAGVPGKNIVQIGINDFANSKFYADRVRDYGIQVIRRSDFEAKQSAKFALEKLAHCQKIYLDIDLDVCDRSFVPAAPAAMPGGITASELRQIVGEIAMDKRVIGFDVTEIDSSIDAPDQRTSRLAALCILEIAASKCLVY
ncbi:MAG: hypothetical protein RLZ57_159 [Actinomycetota bacterium]|jgi:arginase family enzyme